MLLVWASSDFCLSGVSCPRFPIILHDTMDSCREVNIFLRHHLSRGSISSHHTWRAAGQALYDYFSFLQAHNLQWQTVSPAIGVNLTDSYRLWSFSHVGLSRNTVSQRLHFICQFYEFALQQGWITNLPWHNQSRVTVRSPTFLAHLEASSGKTTTRNVMPRRWRQLPAFLSSEQIHSLIITTRNPHHRMLLLMALNTGLRREELASFPLAYISTSCTPSAEIHGNTRISLSPTDGYGMRTKGMKPRDIYISQLFYRNICDYIRLRRHERASLSPSCQQALFLNHRGLPYADGGKHLDRVVREIGHKAGIKVNTHMLRHTWATHTLALLQQQREKNRIEPVVFIQQQLGHSSINTTMRYLHLINTLAEDAILQYSDILNIESGD